jgi:3-oxoacyl-[acyl-carrier-protein] synthase II
MQKVARVGITGFGVFCPIGCEPAQILAALREGRSGIGPVTRYSVGHLQSRMAGEVHLEDAAHSCDRTAQMAVGAARQAWQAANLAPGHYRPQRIGLCVGASGAGLNHGSPEDVFRLRFQPHEQATAVAAALEIQGPVVMFSSASAGSGLALVHAMNLLRGGYCDVVVAGGAECLSQVNHESMDTMRLCSVGACSPFSGDPGLTVGEGSAFFVLERLDEAKARQAQVQVELFSFGVTQDAYDVVGGDPSGEGLAHAFKYALQSWSVDWIKANGTSNRDQDAAETLAIKQAFKSPPPVAALESFVGHANGAAPAIGLGLAIIAFQDGLIPPTLNFKERRAGCDLDYVPNQARMADANRVLASSVGFGGTNVALVFGKPISGASQGRAHAGLCITGVGVVSAFGAGFQSFIEGLSGEAETSKVDRETSGRLTLLQRFALTAATEALASAGLMPAHFDTRRFGLFMGLCRGSALARSEYAAALGDMQARRSMGKYILRMARFTVASAVSQRFQLKGYGATISEGFGAGLHALAHACVHLESSDTEQAMLVIAADETGPGPASALAEMNWLAAGHDGCYLRPYDPASTGTRLSEGAVALVLERSSFAEGRGANILARVKGVGITASQQDCRLSDAIRQAMAKSHFAPGGLAAYGNGSGIWPQDECELKALRGSIPKDAPVGCVNGRLGFAESTSGLFQVAAALHGLKTGEFFSLDGLMRGAFTHQLITARTEAGRNAAVVLGL